jgi:hypothetical protein
VAEVTRSKPRDNTTLSAAEQTAWDEAVAAYRTAAGRGDITQATPMVITNDGLSQVADDAMAPIIDAPLADALKRAAPVYRAHWWAADDKANQFFIGYAAAMLRDAGADLVRAHEAAYHMPWPQRVLVYVAPFGGPFGGYTMTGRAAGAITTMSSRDPGNQGLHALEMLLHESSHAVVNPNRGTIAAAIAAAGKKSGVEAPLFTGRARWKTRSPRWSTRFPGDQPNVR